MLAALMTLLSRTGTTKQGRHTAHDMAERWGGAFRRSPDLARDVVEMGGLLNVQPFRIDDGTPSRLPIDPLRLAYEAGQRDMALTLLSAAKLSRSEIQSLMEITHD